MSIPSIGPARLGWADVDIDVSWYGMNEEETSKALWSQSVLRREGSLASAALNERVDFGRSRADGLVGWCCGFWGLGKWRLDALEVETERGQGFQ